MRYHRDAGEMSLLQAHRFCCTPSPKMVTQDNVVTVSAPDLFMGPKKT
jgi:hypothetical protein